MAEGREKALKTNTGPLAKDAQKSIRNSLFQAMYEKHMQSGKVNMPKELADAIKSGEFVPTIVIDSSNRIDVKSMPKFNPNNNRGTGYGPEGNVFPRSTTERQDLDRMYGGTGSANAAAAQAYRDAGQEGFVARTARERLYPLSPLKNEVFEMDDTAADLAMMERQAQAAEEAANIRDDAFDFVGNAVTGGNGYVTSTDPLGRKTVVRSGPMPKRKPKTYSSLAKFLGK